MKHQLKHWRGLLFSLLLVATLGGLTSCGDDEPKSNVIDYYLDIEEEFLINGSSDLTDRYYSPIKRMREVIRKVYPTLDNKGNDNAVIQACDKEFEEYNQMYDGDSKHFTCLFHLVRAVKRGDVVMENETLRTYNYDINPVEVTPEE